MWNICFYLMQLERKLCHCQYWNCYITFPYENTEKKVVNKIKRAIAPKMNEKNQNNGRE